MKIPLVDLSRQYLNLKEEINQAVLAVLANGVYINGPALKNFEQNFAEFCGVNYAVGLNSGTDALHLALKALGISEGDEVIIPAMTYIATAEAVSYCEAKPVIVDIDQDSYNLDPDLIEAAITSQTKAIIPVHLYGQPADMDRILTIAKKHKLRVIEDCSQAHGARYRGQRVGSFGDVGCFSFYPTKNLGSNGNGGACVTNDLNIYEKIRILANHGSTDKYKHLQVGYNSRLDEIQSAILNVKLKYLDVWNQQRVKIANTYSQKLAEIKEFKLPKEIENCESVFYLYTLQSRNRDLLIEQLKNQNIGTGIYFPRPIHLQPAYEFLQYKKNDFPVAENLAENNFVLPIFPELTPLEVIEVIHAIQIALDNL